MTDENGNEIPKVVRPWANLVTLYGFPVVALCVMAVAAYATMYRIANWSAPKIEAFLHEHSELVQTLKADNLIARETNSKFAESSAKLAESHEKMTRIMESVDRHLETTDKRLEHVEQDVKEIKSHVYAAPPDK